MPLIMQLAWPSKDQLHTVAIKLTQRELIYQRKTNDGMEPLFMTPILMGYLAGSCDLHML